MTTTKELHLRTQLQELQRRHEKLTERIFALDTDINRETESFRQQPLRERRAELVAEREQVASDMVRVEQQIAWESQRPSSPLQNETTEQRSSSSWQQAPNPRRRSTVIVGLIALLAVVFVTLVALIPGLIKNSAPTATPPHLVEAVDVPGPGTNSVPTAATDTPTAVAADHLATPFTSSIETQPVVQDRKPPADVPTPTVTPQPVDIPTPPPTSTPSPTSTPVPPLRFETISIAQFANESTAQGYVLPPENWVQLGGVTFYLPPGRNSVTTQAEPLPANPGQIQLDLNLQRPQQVHLLITGGNVYSRFAGQPIGVIRLRFANSPAISIPLVAGQNIREWKLLDEQTVSTTTSPTTREVWRGGSNFGGIGVIDMLTIDLGSAYRSDRLIGIDVVDTSTETAGSMDPAINLLSVAVAVQ